MASKSGWVIDYANERVRREIRKLPKPILADFEYIRAVIREKGLHEIPPHYIKRLKGEDNIWEFRLTGENTIARAIYLKWEGTRLIILCAFTKKSQHTPRRYIELARKRAKAFKDGG